MSFIDDWQQAIRWAEYDALAEGQADDGERPSPKRAPLQLISIELVKHLARQLVGGVNIATGPFISLMPTGWFRVVFDARAPDSDEIETNDQLLLVFEDEREGFDRLIGQLAKRAPPAFESESVLFEDQRATLETWRTTYLASAARAPTDLLVDIFHLARHLGQGHGAPEFFPFEARRDHDIDQLARRLVERGLDRRAEHEALQAEYVRKDRFWRTIFPRIESFRHYFNASVDRYITGVDAGPVVQPRQDEVPTAYEPDEAVKAQVKRRDGRCLCCGDSRRLTVDHITAVYRGGPGDLDNLQTLCQSCNSTKATRTMRFTMQETLLRAAPRQLTSVAAPRPRDAGDRVHWERFLRRTINFTFECAATSRVGVAGRGDGYYHWTVELVRGNKPSWLEPHLEELVARIQKARRGGGKPEIESLTISSPGEASVRWP